MWALVDQAVLSDIPTNCTLVRDNRYMPWVAWYREWERVEKTWKVIEEKNLIIDVDIIDT